MEIPEAWLLTIITIDVDTDALKSLFQSLDKKLDSGIPELHQRFAETLAQRAEKAFDEEGYPQPWEPSAAAIKGRRKTLQDTRRLKRSFELGASENFFQTVATEMGYGSLVPYGPYHYDESENPKVLRQIIVYDEELKEEFDNDLREWVGEIFADT